MENKDLSAFPFVESAVPGESVSLGLTKREYIATMAMQGILANHWCQNDYLNHIEAIGEDSVVTQAIRFTDALLKELEK